MTGTINLDVANTVLPEGAFVVAENSASNTVEGEIYVSTEHAKEDGGMPQFDPTTFPNQTLWLIVTLIAIYFILARVALPRISNVLEQRSATIQRDLDRAADFKTKAETADQNYQQALVDARTKAHGIVEDAKAKAHSKLDAAIEKADSEIEAQAKVSAKRIGDMQKNADNTVAEIAKDITGAVVEALSPAANDKKIVDQTLTKLLKG